MSGWRINWNAILTPLRSKAIRKYQEMLLKFKFVCIYVHVPITCKRPVCSWPPFYLTAHVIPSAEIISPSILDYDYAVRLIVRSLCVGECAHCLNKDNYLIMSQDSSVLPTSCIALIYLYFCSFSKKGEWLGLCESSAQDNVRAVFRAMWEQCLGQCESSAQDNVRAVFRAMWEQCPGQCESSV